MPSITLTSMTSWFESSISPSLSAVPCTKFASTMSTAPDALLKLAALIVEIASSRRSSVPPFRLTAPAKEAEPASLSVAPVLMVRFLKLVVGAVSVPPLPETVMSSSPSPPSTALPTTLPPPLMFSWSLPAPRLLVTVPVTLVLVKVTIPPKTLTMSLPLPSSMAPSSEAPVLTVRLALPSVSTIARPPLASISAPLSSVIVTAFPAADLIRIPYFFSESVSPPALSTCPDMVTSMAPLVCRDMAAVWFVRWNFPFLAPIKSPAEMVRAPVSTLP